MNNVLEFNRVNVQEPDTIALQVFIGEAIQMNIESLTAILSVLKEDQYDYAIQSVTYRILAAIMSEKEKDSIIGEWIASGSLFLLKDKLEQGFKDSLKISK